MIEVFSLGEPYNTDLVESLHRQARAQLSATTQTGSHVHVLFVGSVVIGSQEHQLLLTLPRPQFDSPLNPAQVHEFYQKHSAEHDLLLLESIVFSSASAVVDQNNHHYTLNIFNQVASEPLPSLKATKLTEILSSLTEGHKPVSTDQLLPRLIDLLKGNEQIFEEIKFIRAYHPMITGELQFVLTTYEAALSIRQEEQSSGGIDKVNEEKNQIESIQSPVQSPTPGITSYLFSSISQVTSAVTSRLPGRSVKDPASASSIDLSAFRERMLACNSASDLLVRDLNPLLEDYKSLLYTLLKE